MRTPVLVNGEVIDACRLEYLSHEELIKLMEAVHREATKRKGICDLCGRRHSKFNICPSYSEPTPYYRERESEFEAAVRRHLNE